MRHFYVSCPTCHHRRMHLIGQSSVRFGSPPTPAERYYQCPNCGHQWTYNVERNFLSPNVPSHVT
jgi:DNA-directed RNA polymerase subunit M/transcription elongation factor TFIIS